MPAKTPKAWTMPDAPKKYPVTFVQKDSGLFLSQEDSRNLMLNIDELDAYILKLKALIGAMEEYYKE